MAFLKTKMNLFVSDFDTEFNEFPKFIVQESINETLLNKLSPFLIKKKRLEIAEQIRTPSKTS